MRPATADEIEQWDTLVAGSPNGGDIFQTKAFAQTKELFDWQSRYIMYDIKNKKIPCLYLVRTVPFLGELWYAPKGPGVTTRADLDIVVKANQHFAADKPIFVFKMEPSLLKTTGYPKKLQDVHNIQPNAYTVIVDLTPSEDDILAGFRQRARRAIRQAQAANVTVGAQPSNKETYHQLYKLYCSTAQHAGFHVRDQQYFYTLWQAWSTAGQGKIFFATHQGKIIAAAFVAFLGQKALYKDGASDREALKNGAAHLLQWEIMRWLKANDITTYNLHGTPPGDQLENKAHPFYGLGLFKTSFGNTVTEYVGTLDQAIKPAAYKTWRRLGERAAQSLEFRLRGRAFY